MQRLQEALLVEKPANPAASQLMSVTRGFSRVPEQLHGLASQQPELDAGVHANQLSLVPTLQPGSLATLLWHFLTTPQPVYSPGLSGAGILGSLISSSTVDPPATLFQTGRGACSGLECVPAIK